MESKSWSVNLPCLDQLIFSCYYWFLKLHHQDKTESYEVHWDWVLHYTFCLFLPIMPFSSQWWLSVMLFLFQKPLLTAQGVTQARFWFHPQTRVFERDLWWREKEREKGCFMVNKCRIACKKIISFIPVHVSHGCCLWSCAHFPSVLCFASGCRPIMYAKLYICINKISSSQAKSFPVCLRQMFVG